MIVVWAWLTDPRRCRKLFVRRQPLFGIFEVLTDEQIAGGVVANRSVFSAFITIPILNLLALDLDIDFLKGAWKIAFALPVFIVATLYFRKQKPRYLAELRRDSTDEGKRDGP